MRLVFTTRSAKSANLRSCARWVHKGVMCRAFKCATCSPPHLRQPIDARPPLAVHARSSTPHADMLSNAPALHYSAARTCTPVCSFKVSFTLLRSALS
jgi:hypothetical protein